MYSSVMVSINGHNLHVETYGPQDGPVVVLLHHGLGSARAWKAQTPVLAAAGYRVIAYDRWGYGASDARPELGMPFFEDDMRDLDALLDELGAQQASLVGHSDGGTLALYYASQQPLRVVRLAVVAAHIYIEPKMDTGIRGVRQIFENEARFREGLHRAHGEKGESVFRHWFGGWVKPENLSWDMRPVLGQIACPTLVIQGVEDEHATPQHARDIARAIPHANLWLLESAGHMLPQDQPDEFNARLLEFLNVGD
jgi:pimeloyl-ACP methyl ester carboxylesterase